MEKSLRILIIQILKYNQNSTLAVVMKNQLCYQSIFKFCLKFNEVNHLWLQFNLIFLCHVTRVLNDN